MARLGPEGFHEAMAAETAALRRCFAPMGAVPGDGRSGLGDGEGGGQQLVWAPAAGAEAECVKIRRDQLGRLGLQSQRPPGRLLLSLVPMHLRGWLRHFPCSQVGQLVVSDRSTGRSMRSRRCLSLACCHGWTGRISCQRSSIPMQTIHLLISSHLPPSNAQVLILRSAGQWSEEALQAAAEFLGLSHAAASVKRAGTATYTGPEHFKFNKGASQGGDGSTTGHSRAPMLAATREILLSFFNDHWDAALEDHTPSDPCAASRRSLPV